MDYPVQPLFRLLQYWHLYSILTCIQGIAKPNLPQRVRKDLTVNEQAHLAALRSHGEAEQWLLTTHAHDFDFTKFIGLDNRQQVDWIPKPIGELDLVWTTASIPAMIASWTLCSRRVYTIPEDLQLLLASTSLEGVDWQRVRFPFNSFVLNLPVPIEDKEGVTYDAILVSQDAPKWGKQAWSEGFEVSPILTVTIIPTRLKSVATDLPIAKQQQLLKQAQGGDPVKAYDTAETIWLGGKQMIPRGKMIFPLDVLQLEPDLFVEMLERREGLGVNHFTGAEFSGKARELNRLVGRILFGFILYLQNTPADQTHAERTEPHETKKVPGQGRVLADAALVCHVQSVYKLDAEEKVVFRDVMLGRGGYEVSTHHREGHMRRPPGKGHDPTAEKTVWVRPAIVRRDRLTEGALPKGTEKVVA